MLEVEIQSFIARCPRERSISQHRAEGRIGPVDVDIANGLWRQRVEVFIGGVPVIPLGADVGDVDDVRFR